VPGVSNITAIDVTYGVVAVTCKRPGPDGHKISCIPQPTAQGVDAEPAPAEVTAQPAVETRPAVPAAIINVGPTPPDAPEVTIETPPAPPPVPPTPVKAVKTAPHAAKPAGQAAPRLPQAHPVVAPQAHVVVPPQEQHTNPERAAQ
jgi:hypothetical protein